MSRVPWLALVAGLVAGCGDVGDDSAAGVVTVVDTVGGVVRIGHSGAAPVWSLEPLLGIGEVGGLAEATPYEFGRIESVIADGDGAVYVADGLAREIRVFGPDGSFLWRLGRPGAGPGEIEGLHGITWLAGDTLLVMDYQNARLMLLTAGGEHAGQWRWLRLTGSTRFLFNGGAREVYAHSVVAGGEGGRSRSVWVRYMPDGPQDTLEVPSLDSPLAGSQAICRGEDGIGFFSNTYGDRFLRIPAPGGERVVAMASAYRVAFLGPAGDTVRVVTREVERVPLTDEAWTVVDTSYQRFRRQWHGADCEGSIERPAHLPVLRELHYDHYGRLLVEYNSSSGATLDLYDHDYRWLATIPAPDRDASVPIFLRDDRLYVAAKDSLDVQRVVGYSLEDGGP